MSRLQRIRDVQVFRRIGIARDCERALDCDPVTRRVVRHIQRQRRKKWKQGSWCSYRRLLHALAARDAGTLTSYEFWSGGRPIGAGDWA